MGRGLHQQSLETIDQKESNLKETIKTDLRFYQGEVDE